MENLFFAAGEIVIDGRFCNPQGVDDIGKGGSMVAVPGKDDSGGIEDEENYRFLPRRRDCA